MRRLINWLLAIPNTDAEGEWLRVYCGSPTDWATRRFDLAYFRQHYAPALKDT